MRPRLFVCVLFSVLFSIDCCVFIKNRKKLLAIIVFHVNTHTFVSSKLKSYCSSFGNAWLSDLLVPSVRICYKCVFPVVCSFGWWVSLSAFQLYHFACRVFLILVFMWQSANVCWTDCSLLLLMVRTDCMWWWYLCKLELYAWTAGCQF